MLTPELDSLGGFSGAFTHGAVDALLASGARFSEKVAVPDARKAGTLAPGRFVRIGPDEEFGRLWAELGIGETLRETVGARRFLHRLLRGPWGRESRPAGRDCVQPYIRGVRLRAVKAVRLQVLGRAGRYRQARDSEDGRDPLDVKEVWHERRRYIGEARYDGRWVLTTNTSLTAAEVALQYKRLWTIEDTFRAIGAPIPPAVRFPQPGTAEHGSVVPQPSRHSVTH